MPYEVQQYAIGRGWRNEWFYDEGDGVIRAETFPTRDEAQAALDEFFTDVAEDIAAGHCPPCSRNEFRIEYVPHAHTQPTAKQESRARRVAGVFCPLSEKWLTPNEWSRMNNG